MNYVRETLTSLEEIIAAENISRTSVKRSATATEFFAVILSALKGSKDVAQIMALLEILVTVLPKSSSSVVRSQFDSLVTKLLNFLKQAVDIGNAKFVRLCVECLGSFLCVQEVSDGFWGNILALQSINILLGFIDDARVRLRHIAKSHLTKLLSLHHMHKGNTIRSYISDFCIEVMKSCSRSDYRRSYFVVLFLENIGPFLINPQKTCFFALQLQECGQPVLTAAVLRMIDSFYQHPQLTLTANEVMETIKPVSYTHLTLPTNREV